jgi:dienelactone hydrolase
MNKSLACVLVLVAAGCPSIETDGTEGSTPPVVEFDPGNRIVPFPNNLLLDPATGKVNLPASCNESATAKALREGVLNTLDGFGTFEGAINVTFSEAFDPDSLADNILVYKRADRGEAVADSEPLPSAALVLVPGMTTRFDADCANPAMINQLTIIPRIPLDQKSTYVVALKSGIKTATGADFTATFTWSLVRQPENPVTVVDGDVVADRTPLNPSDPEDLASLLGVNQLWMAHAQAMAFLKSRNVAHTDVLLAWEFNTQTTTEPLDPAVADSPASKVGTSPLLQVASITGGAGGEAFLRSVLPANSCSADGGPLPCQAVADVYAGGLGSPRYQAQRPEVVAKPPRTAPLPPYGANFGGPIPGAWDHPSAPTANGSEVIVTLALTPAAPCAVTGCPTVIFQHGLGQSKTNVFAIGSQLAATGYAVVAIDAVGHDSRAVRISDQGMCANGGTPPDNLTAPPRSGTTAACYAPFLSPDLGATRDNIRQTVLDQQALVAALKACGTTACNDLKVDPARILYMGQSLGGIMGSMTVGINPDVKAGVLNVPGVGWADILENTATLAIRCPLVDGLIDAGLLVGEKWNPVAGTGLCTTDAWKTQPGYRQFAVIGRWVLDPADPANFTRRLAARRFMIQEVVGDTVVPNIATANEGALTGLMPLTASPLAPTAPPPYAPSTVISTMPAESKWVRYPTLPADGGTGFPGNAFTHGSLLQPFMATPAFQLGVARMQTDAIFYLTQND